MHLLSLRPVRFVEPLLLRTIMYHRSQSLFIVAAFLVLVSACSERTSPPAAPVADVESRTRLTDSLTGTWVGTLSLTGANSVSIRYEIMDNNGQLSGQTFDQEPTSGLFIPTSIVAGTRNGSSAQWTSGTDSVSGTLTGDTFAGTLYVPDDGLGQPVTAQLNLQRNSCAAESDAAFCARLGFDCGTVAAGDNCGVRRVVASCGSCGPSETCQQNVCQ